MVPMISEKNRPTALSGRLEDLPLVDMLQVVSFSTKTGYLLVESPQGDGAVVIRDGRFVCAYSPSTFELLHLLSADHHVKDRDAAIRELIEVSIHELLRWPQGEFRFQLAETLEPSVGGVDISCFLERPGLEAQPLLLRIAKDVDGDRREAKDLLSDVRRRVEHGSSESESSQERSALGVDAPSVVREVPSEAVLSDGDPKTFPTTGDEVAQENKKTTSPDEPATPENASGDSMALQRYLSEMTTSLLSRESGVDISRIVLEVSHRFFQRCFLFLVKQETVSCLDGLGSPIEPKSLRFPLASAPAFKRTVSEGTTQRLTNAELTQHEVVYSKMKRRGEAHLLPILSNREVIAVLYCDDSRTTGDSDLDTLKLFVSQAGLALENRLLRQRLDRFRDSLEG